MLTRFTVITNLCGEFPSTTAKYLVWDTWHNEWTLGFKTRLEAQSQSNDWNTEEVLKLSPLERRATMRLVS